MMKNLYIHIVILWLLSAFSTTAVADNTRVAYRNIEEVSDGVIVTYNFPEFELSTSSYFPGTATWLIPEFGQSDEQGYPSVPFRRDTFAIPDGCRAEVSLVDSTFTIHRNINIAPAYPVIFDGDSIVHLTQMKQYFGAYPSMIVKMEPQTTFRGLGMTSVVVSPLRYDHTKRTAKVFSRIKYKVRFVRDESVRMNANSNIDINGFEPLLSNVICNFNQVIGHNSTRALASNASTPIYSGYLIITTDEYREVINDFVEWKKTLGHTVFIESRPCGQWTESNLTDLVYDYLMNNRIKYLLIIGNNEDVPAQHTQLTVNGTTATGVSDFVYSMPTSNYVLSQILNGRIPADAPYEVENVLQKIIDYERTRYDSDSFYRSGLHCGEFTDQSQTSSVQNGNEVTVTTTFPDDYEDNDFILINEIINEHLTTNYGFSNNRVYYADSLITPRCWNNEVFSNGDFIPYNLRYNFSWNGNNDNIEDAINNGCLYVFFRGLSSRDHWEHPLFTIMDAAYTNNDKYPIVFSIGDETGAYQDSGYSMVETFLKPSNKGSVGVIAPTGNILTAESGTLSLGMFNGLFPNIVPEYYYSYYTTSQTQFEPAHEFREILERGFMKLNETFGTAPNNRIYYTKEIFQCFGDPSMKINTESPHEFTYPDVFFTSTSINVRTDEECTISVYNKTNNTVCTFYGTSAIVEANPYDEISVCLTKHNHIPLIWDSSQDIYIQNEEIYGVRTYYGKNCFIGNNVTNNKTIGDVNIEHSNIVLTGNSLKISSGTKICNSVFKFNNQ